MAIIPFYNADFTLFILFISTDSKGYVYNQTNCTRTGTLVIFVVFFLVFYTIHLQLTHLYFSPKMIQIGISKQCPSIFVYVNSPLLNKIRPNAVRHNKHQAFQLFIIGSINLHLYILSRLHAFPQHDLIYQRR